MEFKYTLQETLEARFTDRDEMMDIVNHGIMGGFHGFLYTHEINEFFNEFESEIEDYYYEIFGDQWMSHCIDNCNSMDEMRARMVWGVAEMWCNDKLDEMELTEV